ncbi:WecB/TagA/CpsF family glycosyltransferase [Rubrivirga sp. IMCC45206]|uniref:WecB/TagA/CpsF family glycosyltransferase n=1 Tax=Rubrivirga sp. IMCC45206 TaxID=3391614 RepID=UPI0039902C91
MSSVSILGVRFDAHTTDTAADQIVDWAQAGEGRSVCFSNAHGVIEAQDDPAVERALNGADLNVPDGMSIVREMRTRGLDQRDRVYGPDATLAVAERCAAEGIPVAFYGSSPAVLAALAERMPETVPGLDIAAAISPPFRPLSDEEDEAFVQQLRASGARVVFVGLGCPRQERWCTEHAARVGAVCLGVGAAFDFHAGLLRQAPRVLQQAGLEWAFRLAMEPRRLWKRYSRVVPRFLIGTAKERRQMSTVTPSAA